MKRHFLIIIATLFSLITVAEVGSFDERNIPHTTDAAWNSLAKGLHASWASIDFATDKYLCPTAKPQQRLALTAWRGERISAKIVAYTADRDGKLSFTVGDNDCAKWIDKSTTGIMTYVLGDPVKQGNNCGYNDRPNIDTTLVADRITTETTTDYHRQTVRPFWITFDVPRTAKKGTYSGTITVSLDGGSKQTLAYSISVVDKTMPEMKDRKFHLDLWQNPFAVARWAGVEPWSDAHLDAMRPLMTRLAAAGQRGITASITHKPWNGQTFDAFENMITEIKSIDGTWSYDFKVLDRWVEFMLSCGVGPYIYCYSVMPWQLSFRYYDQATNTMRDEKLDPKTTEFEQYWVRKLCALAVHMKEKGWFENTIIAMDERPEEQMKIALKVVKAADKDFKLSLAGNYHDSLNDELYDYCIGYDSKFPDGVIESRRAKGLITTYYTCCTEERPNTFMSSPQEEGPALALVSAERGLDGYLRWAYNSWTEDANHDSRFTTWTAGDTYIVYPDNLSSVRFEQLVRGIQLYEKLQTVKKQGRYSKQIKSLLKPFSHAAMPKTNIAKSVKALEKAVR